MILVTGAEGFIGKYLIKELKEKRFSFFSPGYIDLRVARSMDKLPSGIETVIHLAGLIPKKGKITPFSDYMDVNALGSKRLLDAVERRGCKRFIYASTQMAIDPCSDYGFSKAAGERYCMSCGAKMRVISLRFSRIYGAGQNPGFMLTDFIERAQKGLPLIVDCDPRIKRDMLYVKDAVGAILCALKAGSRGIFNIGGGRGVSIGNIAQTISGVFGKGSPVVVYRKPKVPRERYFYFDIDRARAELGFKPRYTLKQGLTDYKEEL